MPVSSVCSSELSTGSFAPVNVHPTAMAATRITATSVYTAIFGFFAISAMRSLMLFPLPVMVVAVFSRAVRFWQVRPIRVLP